MIAHSECGRVHGPNWLKWLGHLRGTPAVGLEIGTFEGDSAEWMLDNVYTHPESRYICIDPFTGAIDHAFAKIDCSDTERKAREKLARFQNVEIHKGCSQDILPAMVAKGMRIDGIYVDGSHTARDTLRDSIYSHDLLKVGGIMIWDDFEWAVMPDLLDRPKIGIEAFLAAYGHHVEALHPRGWQVAARKIKE